MDEFPNDVEKILASVKEGTDATEGWRQFVSDPQGLALIERVVKTTTRKCRWLEEDVRQEVIARLAGGFGNIASGYDPHKGSVFPYITRVIRNRCIDVLDRELRPRASPLPDDPLAFDVSDPHADHTIDDMEEFVTFNANVRAAVAELPTPLHEVLTLSMQGHRLAEIAELLGVPYGTIGSRLHHARAVVRRRVLPPSPSVVALFRELDVSPGQVGALLTKELREATNSCLEQLPENPRKVLSLLILEGQTPKEVARELYLTEENVRKIKARYLGNLQACLTSKGFGPETP